MTGPLFTFMDFETSGLCNRACPTCIRNSHPDRDEVASWFGPNILDEELIYDAIEQAIAMGYRGPVCLAHYNEPLMDERLPAIVRKVRSYPEIKTVHFNTNGDFINPDLVAELDGEADYINVSLYTKDRAKRIEWIRSLFQKTVINYRDGEHMPTHFSPAFDLDKMLPTAQKNICKPSRLIINHRRQYLLCCDDMTGNFGLGTFPEISIREYWFGKRQQIARDLTERGGRSKYPYCMTCPASAPWAVLVNELEL